VIHVFLMVTPVIQIYNVAVQIVRRLQVPSQQVNFVGLHNKNFQGVHSSCERPLFFIVLSRNCLAVKPKADLKTLFR